MSKRVLAWHPDLPEPAVMFRHDDGKLSNYSYPTPGDLRDDGWFVDYETDLPQKHPEPKSKPGYYLAQADMIRYVDDQVLVMRWTGDKWLYPNGEDTSYAWIALTPLTDEQTEKVKTVYAND